MIAKQIDDFVERHKKLTALSKTAIEISKIIRSNPLDDFWDGEGNEDLIHDIDRMARQAGYRLVLLSDEDVESLDHEYSSVEAVIERIKDQLTLYEKRQGSLFSWKKI